MVLVAHSFQRHWRVRQMGWVSFGLLGLITLWVAAVTLSPAGWGLEDRRVRRTAVTLLKQNPYKGSNKLKAYRASLRPAYLLELLQGKTVI